MHITKGIEDEIFLFLEKEMHSGKKWVVYEEGALIKNQKDFFCFTTEFDASQYAHDNTSAFDTMITKPIADIKSNIQQLLTSENNKIMNSQNLEFLQSSLKYFGFGDKLNQALENNIKEQKTEFQLKLEIPHFNNKMDYTLHFKKSDSSEMYFFNRYDAALKNGNPEQDKSQSFYINKGSGITAKEAFNLLEGRSVHKDLVNKDGEKYSAWLKLDFADTDNKGNHKLKQYTEKYGFNLDNTIAAFPIKEMNDPKQKEQLLSSLQKGNAQQVTLTKDGKEGKFYIEAAPQFKTINVYDQKMHMVKRQNFQVPNSIKGESAKTNQKQSESQKANKDTDDGKPKQRQSRKRRLTV